MVFTKWKRIRCSNKYKNQICKKSTRYGINFVMLGMESQEHIHYAMPMRIMGYDYGAYKKQYDNNAVKYKNGNQ